jgi:hypothetical protein
VYITRLIARREFAPGNGEQGRWPSPSRLVSKKASANHVPHTNPEIT